MVTGVAPQYGACATRVDFKERTAEPRNEVKGIAARATFYMYDRYGLSLSRQEQQLFMAWDRQYPVSAWEKEWNSRTSKIMGHPNPFITGDRSWSLGHKPTRDGIVSPIPARATAAPAEKAETRVIIGNRNSKIYHSPQGCPSYDKVAPKNQVPFTSEAKATASGYRKAGNCR